MPKSHIGKRVRKYYDKEKYKQRRMPASFSLRSRASRTLLGKVHYYEIPMTMVISNEDSAGPVTFRKGFSRFNFKDLDNTTVFGINSPPIWARAITMFDEYAITGFRIEYIPSNIMGSVIGTANSPIGMASIGPVTIFEDLNTYSIQNM